MTTSDAVQSEIEQFMSGLRRRNPHQPEFHQAVEEVVRSLMPWVLDREDYRKAQILERLTEPDRIVIFRVTWEDDEGNIRANRAWRVQFNNSIGPYKGGLRFHPTVNMSILKFLGFEQTFKNSLTGLPMGGAKGGANFNPKGKSNGEIMRFCQSLMIELGRHIGEDVDVPAGDIGVGGRELGFLFGQYKRVHNRFAGVLTGKGLPYGGSLVRKEATGFGAVYLADHALREHGHEMEGKTAVVSGSGNVAIYCVEKLVSMGAKVLTVSDSSGFVHDPDGFDYDKLTFLKKLKEERRGRVSEYAERYQAASFHADQAPWSVAADLAFPCATQNELDGDAAKALVENGVVAVTEGANMPCTPEAIHCFEQAGVIFIPGKAANAGGVAVSGLEQAQNAQRVSWTADEVDGRLRNIMRTIHTTATIYGRRKDESVDYVLGANLGGFRKVADAMLAYGAV